MKDSSKYASRLTKLIGRLRKEEGKYDEAKGRDFTTELLMGCLSAQTTEAKAAGAVTKLQEWFVDYNQLRVARADEILDVIGKGYPGGKEGAEQLLRILQAIYDRQDSLGLEHLRELGKREAKTYLEELDGMTPYIASWVMLRCVQGHAFPIHEGMLTMLQGEEAVEAEADAATVQGFLERQITANKIHEVYGLLRHYADHYTGKKKEPGELTEDEKGAAKVLKAAKKAAAKKPAKKAVKKAANSKAKKKVKKSS